MGHVRMPDGREFAISDTNKALADYYRGQGADVEVAAPASQRFPVVQQPGDLAAHPPAEPAPFNPADHTVDEVTDYLDGKDTGEVERVLAAERDGKNRSTLLDLFEDEPEP